MKKNLFKYQKILFVHPGSQNKTSYLKNALDASYDDRITACNRWLNLVNINMKILKTDWGTR